MHCNKVASYHFKSYWIALTIILRKYCIKLYLVYKNYTKLFNQLYNLSCIYIQRVHIWTYIIASYVCVHDFVDSMNNTLKARQSTNCPIYSSYVL